MMTPDKQLTPHFSLYQLTRTDHADLQAANRQVTREEEIKLEELANLLETCRGVLGGDLDVHSGRRYLELNKRVGGSPRSQHLKCEAADFSPAGLDSEETINAAFEKILNAARAGKLQFGQLISESDGRGREGRKVWLHISLGAPHRDKGRCGEALKMVDGKYAVVAKVEWKEGA